MAEPNPQVVRVMSNNAVLARSGDDEFVLVGRGIGFGHRAGDDIDESTVQRQYIEVSPERVDFLKSLAGVDPQTFNTLSAAVDLASDLLGDLHPSVYILLADHLSFALQRIGAGEVIENNLTAEIRASFPTEFAAAEMVVQFINSHLDVTLPVEEAAFIALHLNAARTGDTVKQPLQQANDLNQVLEFISQALSRDNIAKELDDELVYMIVRLMKRVRAGEFRTNDAHISISRDLPRESELSHTIVNRIIGDRAVPRPATGEVAFLAVFLHGWKQTGHTTKNPRV